MKEIEDMMDTPQPNSADQFPSPSENQEDQSSSSTDSQEAFSVSGTANEEEQPAVDATPPPVELCPYCQQAHPEGTLYCPITGKSLSQALSIEAEELSQESTSSPPQEYFRQQPIQRVESRQPYYPAPPQPYPQPYYPGRPLKDRNIALILEILPGMFGLLGFGWIYSGNTSTGIAWLIGVLVWDVMAIIIAVITGSLACICTVPISLVLIAISASSLSSYTKRNPQLFGPLG